MTGKEKEPQAFYSRIAVLYKRQSCVHTTNTCSSTLFNYYPYFNNKVDNYQEESNVYFCRALFVVSFFYDIQRSFCFPGKGDILDMAKRCISIVASEKTYRNLQTFKDIKHLNEAVRDYKKQFQEELSKTAISVLDILHRYAAKFKGVSFLTKNKIAEMLGKSRRTIIRVCQQLEQLGVIRQYEMKRKTDMRQTSNAIVIQPVQNENVTQEHAEMSHQKDLSFKTKQENNNIAAKELLKKFADYKINDILNKGVTVKYISSYINKVFKSLEKQSLRYANNLDTAKRKKQQEQASEWLREAMGIKPEPIPFYNWLEG